MAVSSAKENRYSLYMRLSGLMWPVRKILRQPEFDRQTLLPVPSHYADYAICAFLHANRTWYSVAVTHHVVTTFKVKCHDRVGTVFVNLTENSYITDA